MPQRAFLDEAGSGPAVFSLKSTDRVGWYQLTERFRYKDSVRPEWHFVVPRDLHQFTTDFTSVPRLLTWLVPKDGTHTPAALLHDALVARATPPLDYERDPPGPPVSREEADNVFRHALRHLGVSFARSWMMWGAVSLNSLTKAKLRVYWVALTAVVVVVFGYGGVVQTLDLFDVSLGGYRPQLDWMADRPWTDELRNAVVWSVVAGLASCVLWVTRWQVGAVVATALPILGLPLIICAATYLLYKLVERVIGGLAALFQRLSGSPMPPVNPPVAASRVLTEPEPTRAVPQ
jgi:hypothetical protein